MRKLLITFLLLPLLVMSQTLENIDYIAPFYDGVAAIKKGNEWAFINLAGKIIVDFRSDLVLTKPENENYPIFNNDRCLIAHQKDGILYYGYIDKTGKTVIVPQFLNATNFKENVAIVLKLVKENLGSNDVLMKNVVNYDYFEVVIDKDGEIAQYLTEDPIHITLSKEYLKETPRITSKFISDNLIAIRNKNKKWTVKRIIE